MDLQHLRASDGTGEAVLAHIQTVRTPGSTVLDLDNVDNWNTKAVIITGTPAANGFVSPVGLKVMYGHLSAGDFIIDGFAPGYVDNGNTTSEVAIVKMTTSWADTLIDLLDNTLQDNGLLKLTSLDHFYKPSELIFDHIASGAVLAGLGYGANLNASLSAGVMYVNGLRNVIPAVATRAYTASKDTYVDALYNSNGTATIVYTEVANNAASPALAANSVRIGIVVSGATIVNAGSINQGQTRQLVPVVGGRYLTKVDSIGNIIYPRDPQRKIIGHAYLGSAFSQSTASGTAVAITGLFTPAIIPTGRDIKVMIDIEMGQSASVYADLDLYDGAVPGGTLLNWKRNWYNDNGGRAHEVHMTTIPARLAAGLHTISAGFHAEGGGTAFINSSGGGTEIIVELAG